MKTEAVKVIVLATLLVVTFFASMLPLFIARQIRMTLDPTRRSTRQRIISFLSCFGGGVFLATCLMDLFPEVQEQLLNGMEKLNIKTSFPFSEFIMIFGFLMVLTTEQIILTWKERSPETHPLLGHSHNHNVLDSDYSVSPAFDHQSSIESVGSLEGISNHPHPEDHISFSVHEDPSSHSTLRSALLVLALSLHSVFEGLAIGLQPNVEDVLKVFGAVTIHKTIIAFTLGLNVVQSKFSHKTAIICILLFSVMAPLGLAIGLTVMNVVQGSGIALTSGVLQGLACGTFLYVTFFEVLPHELNSSHDRLLKLVFVILGFCVVCTLVGLQPD
ncbi:zinc transporter ZIP1-like [Tachypleus tridentatus]|uniref:zinc transporter ZIP1-like n=1 Tax=Tachypleus tridentatus TaxID=6853 RepID=UPI003FD0A687